jgi:hypothetical protein
MLSSHEAWYNVDLDRLPIYGCILQKEWIFILAARAKGDCQQAHSRTVAERSFERISCPEWGALRAWLVA